MAKKKKQNNTGLLIYAGIGVLVILALGSGIISRFSANASGLLREALVGKKTDLAMTELIFSVSNYMGETFKKDAGGWLVHGGSTVMRSAAPGLGGVRHVAVAKLADGKAVWKHEYDSLAFGVSQPRILSADGGYALVGGDYRGRLSVVFADALGNTLKAAVYGELRGIPVEINGKVYVPVQDGKKIKIAVISVKNAVLSMPLGIAGAAPAFVELHECGEDILVGANSADAGKNFYLCVLSAAGEVKWENNFISSVPGMLSLKPMVTKEHIILAEMSNAPSPYQRIAMFDKQGKMVYDAACDKTPGDYKNPVFAVSDGRGAAVFFNNYTPSEMKQYVSAVFAFGAEKPFEAVLSNGDAREEITGFVPGDGGDFVLCGARKKRIHGNVNPSTDIFVMRVSGRGIKKWDKTFVTRVEDSAQAIYKAEDGNFLLTGITESAGNAPSFYMLKVSPSGRKVMEKYFMFYPLSVEKDNGFFDITGKFGPDIRRLRLDEGGRQVKVVK